MSQLLRYFAFILAMSWATQAVWADLKSPTYTKAKHAYAQSDWGDALRWLNQYIREDAPFLEKNVEIKQAVEAAVTYCKSQSSDVELSGLGAEKGNKPAPALP